MTSDILTLEQVRFIAATVAPHFGPMVDKASLGPPIDDAWRASLAPVANYWPLTKLICAEAGDVADAEDSYDKLAARAVSIVGITLVVHGTRALSEVIIAELTPHSRVLTGQGAV